jgi:hypothetical protein
MKRIQCALVACGVTLFCTFAHAQTAEETVFFLVITWEDGEVLPPYGIVKKRATSAWDIHQRFGPDGKPLPIMDDRTINLAESGWRAVSTHSVSRINNCQYLLQVRSPSEDKNKQPDFAKMSETNLQLDFTNVRDISIESPFPPYYSIEYVGGTVADRRDVKALQRKLVSELVLEPKRLDRIKRAYEYFRSTFCKGRAF